MNLNFYETETGKTSSNRGQTINETLTQKFVNSKKSELHKTLQIKFNDNFHFFLIVRFLNGNFLNIQ